jgi:hypothetical protein
MWRLSKMISRAGLYYMYRRAVSMQLLLLSHPGLFLCHFFGVQVHGRIMCYLYLFRIMVAKLNPCHYWSHAENETLDRTYKNYRLWHYYSSFELWSLKWFLQSLKWLETQENMSWLHCDRCWSLNSTSLKLQNMICTRAPIDASWDASTSVRLQ